MKISNLYNKILTFIKKSRISLPVNDSNDYPVSQIVFDDKTSNMLNIFPYGFYAIAPENTLVLTFKIGSKEENLAGIPYMCSERFKNNSVGEVIAGSPLFGTYIKFDKEGSIQIFSKNKIQINNQQLGFFGKDAVNQQSGGALTAGSDYTSNEQNMLNKVYSAMQNYGLLN